MPKSQGTVNRYTNTTNLVVDGITQKLFELGMSEQDVYQALRFGYDKSPNYRSTGKAHEKAVQHVVKASQEAAFKYVAQETSARLSNEKVELPTRKAGRPRAKASK